MDATTEIPPAVTEETGAFWAAGKEGRLLVPGAVDPHPERFVLSDVVDLPAEVNALSLVP